MKEKILNLHEDGLQIIREFIPPMFAFYLKTCLDILDQNNKLDNKDRLVPISRGVYADTSFESVLSCSTNSLANLVGKQLSPTFSYARIYEKGADLPIHIDRGACEYTISLHLGGVYENDWPLVFSKNRDGTNPIPVFMRPGDAVLYKGTEMFHWRNKFEGSLHYQASFHYVDVNGKLKNHSLDSRQKLGSVKSY